MLVAALVSIFPPELPSLPLYLPCLFIMNRVLNSTLQVVFPFFLLEDYAEVLRVEIETRRVYAHATNMSDMSL